MNNKTIARVLLIVLVTAGNCLAGSCAKSARACRAKKSDVNSVEKVLEQLDRKTAELQTYEGRIEYLFIQPLLEDKTLRKGILYYERSGKESQLRINFETLRQDDEDEEKYMEHFLFDGIWLTRVDYQIKQVTRQQLAEPPEPNESVDAFDLVSRNFPIIGFGKTEDFKKEFEIKLIEQQGGRQDDFVRLHLKVKPDSRYKDDYTSIDFWIDEKLGLPTKIVATSIEDDIYEIRLVEPKVNERIDKKVFDFKIPEGFTVEIKPLKKGGTGVKATAR